MRILVVGIGGIGQRHLRNLRTILGPEAELLAFRVRGLRHTLTDQLEVEPGTDVVARYGIRVFDDLEDAIAAAPEAAFVCNPTSLHVPMALRLARAGCHLFIEKPLSHSLEGVDELLAVIGAKGLVSMVGYQLRFHPVVRTLRGWVEHRRMGRIIAVRAEVGEYLPGWHRYEDYRQMYASRADLGGGVILSQIHEVDYLGWLFGWPRRVFAVGGHLSALEVDVEDTASLLMETRVDGRMIPIHLHLDYLQRPPSRTCQVIGDAGKAVMDLRAATSTLFDASGNVAETVSFPDFPRNQLFLDEASHFLRCISQKERADVSVAEGLLSLKVALAAKASLLCGEPVTVEERAS
jgi:predicted dehydrogenase